MKNFIFFLGLVFLSACANTEQSKDSDRNPASLPSAEEDAFVQSFVEEVEDAPSGKY